VWGTSTSKTGLSANIVPLGRHCGTFAQAT
jgi:hypothetical protein